jgi:peptidoglycan/LPS O-acetylase OafA/YrhL
VDIFFILSGFLITTLLIEEWDSRGTISLAHFYLRRALRLFPALIVALLGFALLTAVALALRRAGPALTAASATKGALLGLFYVSNVAQAAGTQVPSGIGHLWSLATEEQFYLLWPTCLVLALRLRVSKRTLGIGLAAAIGVVAAHRLELTLRGLPQRRLYFAPDGSFDLILVGCLAGLWFRWAGDRALEVTRRLCRVVWLPCCVGAVSAILVAQIFDRALYEGLFLAFGVLIAVLLLTVILDERCLLARLLAFGPFVYVGKISYALYLWHQIILGSGLLPVGTYPRAAVGVPLSFAAASASYYFVERPFLRLKRRDRRAIEPGEVLVAETPPQPAGQPR